MNPLFQLIKNVAGGLSPSMRTMAEAALKELSGYRGSRQEIMRAIAERNLKLQDLERGMAHLQNGPLASLVNRFMPGLLPGLQNLGREIIEEKKQAGDSPTAPEGGVQPRAGNPFPPIKR